MIICPFTHHVNRLFYKIDCEMRRRVVKFAGYDEPCILQV